MPNIKKFLLSLFLTLIILLGSTSYSIAAGLEDLWNHKWYSEQDPFSWYNKVYNPNLSPDEDIFGERYTAAQVQWVIYGLFSFVWNFIPGNPELTNCATGGDLDQCWNRFWENMQIINDTFNPLSSGGPKESSSLALTIVSTIGSNPVSGIGYVSEIIGKLSPVNEVMAQGYGYDAAASIREIWRASRDLSFMLMIPAILIMAFMIMFRVKISPQIVISVQSALPKVIISLILITFSYAIAGFAIDLMYVVIGLISIFIGGADLSNLSNIELFREFTSGNNAFGLLYSYWLSFVWAMFLSIFISGKVVLGILGFLFAFLAIVAVFVWSIKIIFLMFKTFAQVLLLIVLGPLEILAGALFPASKVGFSSWFKKLISHLAVYPVMGLMFFFSFFFLHQGIGTGGSSNFQKLVAFNPKENAITSNPWEPPLSWGAVGDSSDTFIWIIVSFMIFSQITKVSEIIQATIAGKPFNYGTALEEATQGAIVSGNVVSSNEEARYKRILASGRIPGTAEATLHGLLNGLSTISGGRIKRQGP